MAKDIRMSVMPFGKPAARLTDGEAGIIIDWKQTVVTKNKTQNSDAEINAEIEKKV